MNSKLMMAVVIGVIIGLGLGWVALKTNTVQAVSPKEHELHLAMNKLWEDHVTWTRSWLISEAYNTGDADNVAARLLKNQEDIGNAIKPYYGDEAGNQLTQLLKEHIIIATELVKAAKANDSEAVNAANTKWHDNANQIAAFLANANPNWRREDLEKMMKDHLDLTKQEGLDIIGKNYDAGITDYDKLHEQILMMSDALSSGIVKQFPGKF
jgi:hypothetical protein